MKKKLKKVCAGILCATLALTVMVPTTKVEDVVTVAAEENYDGEVTCNGRTYQYKIKSETEVGLVSVKEGGGELGIPSRIKIDRTYYTVTSLEDWFGAGQIFSKVYVPNTVKTLAKYIFYGAKIDVLQISNNLETVDDYLCGGDARVNSVSCNSKKIKSIGGYAFYSDNNPEIIVLGDWLVKATARKGSHVLDLTKSKLLNVSKVCKYAVGVNENITDLMLSSKIDYDVILNQDSFLNYSNRFIENVYIDGGIVSCNSANDTCPNIIKKHYSVFQRSAFSLNYSYQKAKHLLKKLGIKYYGKECEKVKGTLCAKEEYDIALKVHDYIVNNYVYDASVNTSFDSVFNCHTVSKCQYDAEMYAFLLECAGVEAEVVFSREAKKVSSSEKENYVKEHPDETHPKGNYIYGYDGNHAWDAIKIGGKWYYVDTTNDRKNDFYALFLFSNMTIEKGYLFLAFYEYTDLDGNNVVLTDLIHEYPHFETYEYYTSPDWVNEWILSTHPFQNKETMLEVPECNEVNGDIDMNYYCYDRYKNNKEIKLYRAFLLQSDEMQQRIMNSKDGYITASEEEIAALNGVRNVRTGEKTKLVEVEKDTNKLKLLINSKGLDINFDGEIRANDLVALMQRSCCKPSDYK